MPQRKAITDIKFEKFATFGELLRYVRERAHLTQRELAAQVGYHYSYISYLEKNLRLPDEASLMGRFVPALSLEEEPELIARMLELIKEKQKKSLAPTQRGAPTIGESKAQRLPTSLTSMVGRERESADLSKLLNHADVRLITLIGPPGVGKTRLALHVAEKVEKSFRDGAIFVNLAPINQPENLLLAIASAFGMQDSNHENLSRNLRDKNLLFVLDNFEQIIDAAPQLIDLLGDAPGVKILATSREALRLRGEQEFHISPLPISQDNILDSPAVQLFLERARAIKLDFKTDTENASRVGEICRRLDGLPLAIELAAARVGSMSLPTMLEQLDHRFEWLTRGARDLPLWRQTLWSAINWSYALLSVQERALFSRLAVFRGGWTLEAAQTICSDDTLCTRSDIFDLLSQLVDRSLVIADTKDGRFSFLETLREFAIEMLKESGDLEHLRQAHCDYFLKFAQTASPHIKHGNEQFRWLAMMEREHNNVREALSWAVESKDLVALSMEFAQAMHVFWLTRSYIGEARRWLDKILALDRAPSLIRANLLRYASDYASAQGDLTVAQRFEEEGLEISKTLEDEAGIYSSLDGMATLAGRRGDYSRAAEILEQVLSYRRQSANSGRLTITLNNLAIATRRLGNLDRAKELYFESIANAEKIGDQSSLAHALLGLAEVHIDKEEYELALPLQQRTIVIRQQLGSPRGMSFSLSSLAVTMQYLGRDKIAVQFESAADKIRRELGVTISPATRAEYEELIVKLRSNLGEQEFEQAWFTGQGMTLEQVIVLAMNVTL